MGWKVREAQEKGVPVGDVLNSWAAHLVKERRKLRDNPRSLDASKPPESYQLAVTQESTGAGTRWRTLGELPHGIRDITVMANSFEAARNKVSVRTLLEQRYRAELASALQRAGLYATDLEGRRAAMAAAIASPISVVDLAEAVKA